MSHPIDHVRVGQAWTAYVAPVVLCLLLCLFGIGLVASSLGAFPATTTSEASLAIAADVPAPVMTHRKPKNAHPVVQPAQALSATPKAQDGSSQLMLPGIALIAAASLYLACRVLSIRSRCLFTDDTGVWLHSGVLPWTRGTRGVKWRDLEGATVFTGFASWLLRSHTLRVSHRFTKSSEIVITHVPRGAQVVGHINAIHHRLLADPASQLGIDAAR